MDHIVIFKWKESATQGDINNAIINIKKLAYSIDEVVQITAGNTFTSERSKGFQTAICVRLNSRESLER